MELAGLLQEAKHIYAGDQPVKTESEIMRTLNKILVEFLNTEGDARELADKHHADKKLTYFFLRDFEELALKAWEVYVSRKNSSLAGAAEAVGMKRFCFEDYFWLNKGVDDDSEEARERLRAVKQEFETRYNP